MNVKSLVRIRGRAAASIEDAAESVSEAAGRLTQEARDQFREQVGEAREQFADRVAKARRDLADRIDPDPIPRRLRRWLLLGAVLGAAVAAAAVVWGRRSRRSQEIFFDASENGQGPANDEPESSTMRAAADSRNGGSAP